MQLDFHGDETWTRDKERDIYILGQVLVDPAARGAARGQGRRLRRRRERRRSRARRTRSAAFSIQFGCAPERVDELIKATFDEIARSQKDGIGADYLDKVKQTFTRERETAAAHERVLGRAGSIAAYRYGDDPTIILDPIEMIARMTSDNVKAAAKRYLDPKQYYQAVMLPEKPAQSAPKP